MFMFSFVGPTVFCVSYCVSEFQIQLFENSTGTVFLILPVGPKVPEKNDDDILDIASSRIAALAAISSSDGNFFFMVQLSLEIS